MEQKLVHITNTSINKPEGNLTAAMAKLRSVAPRIHCLTNAVTVQDVANILLAVGGSAIMASDALEVEEVTSICHGLLLNTGTPDQEKFSSCILAGRRAAALGHPIVLDPVGAGVSHFRREQLKLLLHDIHTDLIRCNLEEAATLLELAQAGGRPLPYPIAHGGVESGIHADDATRISVAGRLAYTYQAVVLLTGRTDTVSDGIRSISIEGGDPRIRQITGSGCMLSALCAAFLAAGLGRMEAAVSAALLWKHAAGYAGEYADRTQAGMGSFHMALFDAASLACEVPSTFARIVPGQVFPGKGSLQASPKITPAALRLYAVSDSCWLKGGETLAGLLPILFENGVTCFQLREKHLPEELFLQEALEIREICRRYHVPFIINDNVAVAKLAGADGVHVGVSDMGIERAREILGTDAVIGASAHSVAEAMAAQAAGADYLGCGAVFGSATKTDATTLPLSELQAICHAVRIPVVAIGGIHPGNLSLLSGSGIAGPAVISALSARPDIAAAVKGLRGLSDKLFG